MRLKKLSIVGFKSFADKVSLDFDCEIIGIVGPNGCGKSNIVDAFRWVMGEQSAKSMRGEKMDDVLFAGTDNRSPLGYAEVSVTFTDIGGALPTPYDEITITRRLHRNGESEYLLNKQPSRLKDIQGLLLGSGMGKNAFSIFEQGKLDQIIHLNPVERRVIFDEAAGTSRFLLRKKEALRRLSGVTENYNRIHDVHAEIEKQTKQLKKQASHAKSYQENKIVLIELEKNILIYRLGVINDKNIAIESTLKGFNEQIKEKEGAIDNLEKTFKSSKEKLQFEELAAKEKQKEYSLLETKVRVGEAEIKQQKQRLFETKSREKSIDRHLEDLKKELEEKLLENKKNELLLQTLLEKKQSHEQSFAACSQAHEQLENQLSSLKETAKKHQASYLALLKESESFNKQLNDRKIRYEGDLARLQSLKAVEEQKLVSRQQLELLITQQKKNVETLSLEIDAFKIQLSEVEKKISDLRQQKDAQQKQQQASGSSLTETGVKRKILLKLKEEFEGFSTGVKALLKEAKNKKSPLFQKIEPLFEVLIPEKGYEALIAASMRPYAETLLVESEADFKELLAFAKAKKISDFSVLVMPPQKKNVSKKDSLYEHVQENSVAEHFTNQTIIAGESAFYDHLGVFFCYGGEKRQSIFEREAELKSLSESMSELEKKHAEIEKEVIETSQNLKLKETERNEILEVRRKKEMDLVKENFTLQRALSDAEKNKTELILLLKEKEKSNSIQIEQAELVKLEVLLAEKKQNADSFLTDLRSHETLCEKEEQHFRQSKERLQTALNLFQSTKDEWQKCQNQIKIFEAKQQQIVSHQQKLSGELGELAKILEETFKILSETEKQLELDLKKLQVMKHGVKEGELSLQIAKQVCLEQEKELGLLRKQTGVLEKERHSLEISLAEDAASKKALESELIQKYSMHPEHLLDYNTNLEISLEEAERQVHELRHSLEKAGSVNMMAIEEFEQQKERFEFLDRQMKDLEEAKEDLEKIIAQLDQESRKIFKTTFSEIRAHFQKNFQILFKGGFADLTFTDSTDILEAGIEIVAKPPGKQMRSISLLSGGEKCLTALALLFSIFEVRPAPFCILDEVDAPLDDSNVERFTSILKQFIEKTQFIIVTHNKKTMSIADVLVGVSMEEKGVSKLISLAFEKTLTKENDKVKIPQPALS